MPQSISRNFFNILTFLRWHKVKTFEMSTFAKNFNLKIFYLATYILLRNWYTQRDTVLCITQLAITHFEKKMFWEFPIQILKNWSQVVFYANEAHFNLSLRKIAASIFGNFFKENGTCWHFRNILHSFAFLKCFFVNFFCNFECFSAHYWNCLLFLNSQKKKIYIFFIILYLKKKQL